MSMFKVSLIIPTFNCAFVLKQCLESINDQDYSKEWVEIIVADAGSSDETVKIAQKYTRHIFLNPLKTGEAGKAIGFKKASGEILAFIDSDNILPHKQWLRKMLFPFLDTEILASEPLFYTHRKEDYFITRYCALLGMNDPLCHFLGNYDRFNLLTKKWTEMRVSSHDQGEYYKIGFLSRMIPTLGANGFFIRKLTLQSLNIGDYFHDIDILPMLIDQRGIENVKVAKVKEGIIHFYCQSISHFIQKQRRRVCDYVYFSAKQQRRYAWDKTSRIKIAKFGFYTIFMLPLFFQTLKGFMRKKDLAWFFHPLACFLTFYIYSFEILRSKLMTPETFYIRKNWFFYTKRDKNF